MTGDDLVNQLLLLGISMVRTLAIFALMPVFAPQVIPPMVRNSMAVSFGLIVLYLQPDMSALHLDAPRWVVLFLREAFIGLLIGFFFSAILWSFEAVGQMIDAKIGPAQPALTDPMSGEQTTLHGAVVGRIASFIFMISGGIGLLIQTLLSSYVIWPIQAAAPRLRLLDSSLIQGEFGRIMALAIGFAAPALVILTAVEGGMGLINRFVPQLNVFTASLSIKSLLATVVVLGMLGLMVNTIINQTLGRSDVALHLVRSVMGQ